MLSTAIDEVIKIMEVLPVELQNQLVEHLREYVTDLQDDQKWDESFERTQDKLIMAAKRAKQEIAEGKAVELDYNLL
ncbi:hypothetical protein C7H19_21610 [Aphanothece hegewaldii CCALA 016]|uniref:DUF2281 domain-containing protein n=1 Tax=Aphanothece hegewaldii CCALA 016 TaxID=2107694 RepID=A0A2T1LSA5_9CHRO|nr:hypothetical protein [Aphanothece hegewaldii]PSF32493.1 hypothetical protein C7H19_21610 [Aphanothece hegewaldii CCALA 016]